MNAPPVSKPHRRAHLLAAAGLLHDIGKVGQAAGIELDPAIQNLADQTCPADAQGRSQYQHVLYSLHFLHKAASKQVDYGGLDANELFNLVANHHRASNDLDQCLLRKANWLAAGYDRTEPPIEDPHTGEITGLWPILASLCWSHEGKAAAQKASVVPTRVLSFDEDSILPVEKQDRESYCQACWKIWHQLEKEIGLRYRDPSDCVQRLEALVQRTLQAVPASRQFAQQADVALAEHSRVTAAFAACLAVLHSSDSPTATECDPAKIVGRYRLLLMSAGRIQDFIFRSVPLLDSPPGETVEKGMARTLRARSFYVSLLTWLGARRLLDAAGLPSVNLVFDGGGRCMLLLPDDQQLLQRVRQAIQYLDNWIAQQLGNVLRFDIALSQPLCDADFSRERFPKTFRLVDRQLSEARMRLPWSVLQQENSWAQQGWIDDRPSLPVDRKDFVDKMRELGRALPKAQFLSIDQNDPHTKPLLEVFGYKVRLHRQCPNDLSNCYALQPDALLPLSLPLYLASSYVPVSTHADVDRLKQAAVANDRTATDITTATDQLLTFGDLAYLAEDENGAPIAHDMLATLKADVDYLGMLLGYGLQDNLSLSRYASVARTLDQFFKGFLSEQLRRSFRHIYTVFAGGDDLLLIGPWYDVVRFAEKLHKWFCQLTCNNADVTISAGLIFARSSTPARHLAQLAEHALEESKKGGRNRITLGSCTMEWRYYHEGLALHRLMRELAVPNANTKRPPLTSSLVFRLLRYAQMALGRRRGGKPHPADLKWRAQLSYDLARNLPLGSKPPEKLKQFHTELMKIRSAEQASVLYTASLLTLYYLRGARK